MNGACLVTATPATRVCERGEGVSPLSNVEVRAGCLMAADVWLVWARIMVLSKTPGSVFLYDTVFYNDQMQSHKTRHNPTTTPRPPGAARIAKGRTGKKRPCKDDRYGKIPYVSSIEERDTRSMSLSARPCDLLA